MSALASLRIGTLEITAALIAVALVAGRPRLRSEAELGRFGPVRVSIDIDEHGAHRAYEGFAPFEVGRDKEAALALADPEVSRRHARFELRGGIVFLRDLESRNGTFLNGRLVSEPIEVRKGDDIDVGTTRLRIEGLGTWT